MVLEPETQVYVGREAVSVRIPSREGVRIPVLEIVTVLFVAPSGHILLVEDITQADIEVHEPVFLHTVHRLVHLPGITTVQVECKGVSGATIDWTVILYVNELRTDAI